jgi:hypothetical protein
MKDTEECPVCFSGVPDLKLVCGHSFCTECIKKWYMHGESHTCPMCRKNIYFRGMCRIKDEWDEDIYGTKLADIFSEYFDDIANLDLRPQDLLFAFTCFEYQFNNLRDNVHVDDIEYMLENFIHAYPSSTSGTIIIYDDNPNLKFLRISKKKRYIFKKSIYS